MQVADQRFGVFAVDRDPVVRECNNLLRAGQLTFIYNDLPPSLALGICNTQFFKPRVDVDEPFHRHDRMAARLQGVCPRARAHAEVVRDPLSGVQFGGLSGKLGGVGVADDVPRPFL